MIFSDADYAEAPADNYGAASNADEAVEEYDDYDPSDVPADQAAPLDSYGVDQVDKKILILFFLYILLLTYSNFFLSISFAITFFLISLSFFLFVSLLSLSFLLAFFLYIYIFFFLSYIHFFPSFRFFFLSFYIRFIFL